MQYRPEIDGLRTLAVLPVIFFHAGFNLFSGGFVGVDVFFVISGYLITTLILNDLAARKFSFSNFYLRRAKRILPALFFYITISLIFVVIIYPPHMLKDYGQSLVSNSVFASNIFFFLETEYFNDFSETAPLLHTWSLSVEEQYYLIVPLLLISIYKYLKKLFGVIIGLLVILSLLYSEQSLSKDTALSFYMITSRFWELGVGSLIAIYFLNNKNGRISKYSLCYATIGLLFIIIPIFYYTHNTSFPGLSALFPTIGTGLIIVFTKDHNLVTKLLSVKWLVNIGKMSYSWYLSHHIIFSISRVYGLNDDDLIIISILIGISYLLAKLSYLFIENPIRKSSIAPRYVVSISSIFLISFGLIGYKLHTTEGLKDYKISMLDNETAELVIDYPVVFKLILEL